MKKINKPKKEPRMRVISRKYKPMAIEIFRKKHIEEGYDLIDITKSCEFKLGESGWCNDFNKPLEEIYHIQVYYRDEEIGALHPSIKQPNWDYKYVVFISEEEDFIIFRKVKVEKAK